MEILLKIVYRIRTLYYDEAMMNEHNGQLIPAPTAPIELLNNIPENLQEETLRLIRSEMNNPSLAELTHKHIEPMLALWHKLLLQQKEAGLSTKESAMLLLALKTSLTEQQFSEQEFSHIQKLLDILGILTVELFSAEQERVINRQDQTIHFLLQTQEEKNIIAHSAAMKAVLDSITPVLNNDVTVLLQGETGTGKDVLATLIHNHSHRKTKPFIAINCGAIPKDLIEAELFGAEKGAFTGADQLRLGKFELAEGGTLFLDEIGDLSTDLQVKLLRVLQNKEFFRLGGTEAIPTNVRIIAATHRDLKQLVDQQLFRQDLFYRLSVYPIDIPPLRERKEDIVPLAYFFIDQYTKAFGLEKKSLSVDAKTYLEDQIWEGNVRELENVIQRSLILSTQPLITKQTLTTKPGKQNLLELQPGTDKQPDILPLAASEKTAIEKALKHVQWNIKKAAEALDISRTTLYSKMKQYNISEEKKEN